MTTNLYGNDICRRAGRTTIIGDVDVALTLVEFARCALQQLNLVQEYAVVYLNDLLRDVENACQTVTEYLACECGIQRDVK